MSNSDRKQSSAILFLQHLGTFTVDLQFKLTFPKIDMLLLK